MSISFVLRASRLVPSSTGGSGSFDDTGASNKVMAIVVALVLLGLVVLVVTAWAWRTTRPQPEALGPLEVLSRRKFRRSTEERRRRALLAARPNANDGEQEYLPEMADLAALAARPLPSLDELAEPSGNGLADPWPAPTDVTSAEASAPRRANAPSPD